MRELSLAIILEACFTKRMKDRDAFSVLLEFPNDDVMLCRERRVFFFHYLTIQE